MYLFHILFISLCSSSNNTNAANWSLEAGASTSQPGRYSPTRNLWYILIRFLSPFRTYNSYSAANGWSWAAPGSLSRGTQPGAYQPGMASHVVKEGEQTVLFQQNHWRISVGTSSRIRRPRPMPSLGWTSWRQTPNTT